MAKATTTIRQVLTHQPEHRAWFAATQALFNRVAAFYFEVIQAHEGILDLSNKEALTALEKLTHTTEKNPHPVMPLSQIAEDLPAMFRRAAIHAALGSARSFFAHLKKWQSKKEKAAANLALQRFARGVYENKIAKEEVNDIVKPVSDLKPNGRWKLKENPTRLELSSKCGRERVGVGSNVGSLGGKCLLMQK